MQRFLLGVVVGLLGPAVAAQEITSVPATMILDLPSSAPILSKFAPSPPPASGAFQRNQSIHCFGFGDDGQPNFVHGSAMGYWYFEGAVVPSPGTSTLVLHAPNPEWGGEAIAGSISLRYSADFTSATIVSVACSNAWCGMWPSELVNGRPAPSDVSTATYCLFELGATPGTADELTSQWTSDTGTTWMCPVPGSQNEVNGTWLYINNADTCMPQTGQPFPCPNNTGPYYNGYRYTMPDNGGLIVTQWEGWNFAGANGTANGRSIFGLPTPTAVYGLFCVFNLVSGQIQYCFPEPYTVVATPTQAECNAADVFPPQFAAHRLSTPAHPQATPSSVKHSSKLSGGDIAGIVIAVIVVGGIIVALYVKGATQQKGTYREMTTNDAYVGATNDVYEGSVSYATA